MRGPLLLTLIALVCGCSANDSTLIVELRTDLRSGVDFQSIRTRVFDGSSAEAEREVIAPAPAARDLSTGFRAAEIPGLIAGPKRVELALLDASSSVVAERTIRAELSGTGAISASVTRSCSGIVCPGATDAPSQTECLGGRCVSRGCLEGVPEACGEPMLSLGELLRRSVDATCEMIRSCTGALAENILKGDSCESVVGRNYSEAVAAPVSASQFEGRVIYHPERAHGCLNALRSRCRGYALTKQTLECYEAIEGTIPLGEGCTTDFDCAGVGSFCDTGRSCPGICTARVPTGEACASIGGCEPGLYCHENTCAEFVAPGDVCNTGALSCGFDALCLELSGGPPACHPVSEVFVAAEGEACGAALGTFCGDGLVCTLAGSGEPHCVGRSTSGAPCVLSVPDSCPVAEYCDSASRRCSLLPLAGAPCLIVEEEGYCGPGAECDLTSRTCVGQVATGEACTSNAQCTFDVCFRGVCAGACAP